MKNILSTCMILFLSQLAFSQGNIDTNIVQKNTNIKIIKDNRIDELNKIHTATFELRGFRVQIYSGNKKQPANQARSTFLKIHPKTKAHLNYEQPYYKVRVGDFKTKLEALKYKNAIAQEFPNCFIVRDEIDMEQLD
jgi:hypothetical protein